MELVRWDSSLQIIINLRYWQLLLYKENKQAPLAPCVHAWLVDKEICTPDALRAQNGRSGSIKKGSAARAEFKIRSFVYEGHASTLYPAVTPDCFEQLKMAKACF